MNFANLQSQQWPASEDELKVLGNQLKTFKEQYLAAIANGQGDQLGLVTKSLIEPALFRLHHRSRAPLAKTYTPGGNCEPGGRKLHVTTDGRFQPCESTGDYLNLGNIDLGLQAESGQKLKEDFFKTVHQKCETCWALRQCGICYANWAESCAAGNFSHPIPESLCKQIKNRT
ncbi:MAG: SPASM domain-containing protein [bacterium]|nr:SPASM domain-containing protein [bacterium]